MSKRLISGLAAFVACLHPLSAQFVLLEDFESGFASGSTLDGVNGWSAGDPSRALAANDPGSSGRGMVGHSVQGVQDQVFRALGGSSEIGDGATGTLFFEIYFPAAGAGTANVSMGLSDVGTPSGYGSFEAQFRFSGSDIFPRSGGGFTDTGFDFDTGTWLKVWLVANNGSDEVDMYVESPSGSGGQVLVADDYAFRNGTSDPLSTFLLVQNNGQDAYFDNIYVDPAAQNLTDPVPRDSDNDGLLDSEEDFGLGSFQGPGVTPAWSDPGNPDTDADGYLDGVEVVAGTDPNDAGSVPGGAIGFQTLEDFEDPGFVTGSTLDGVNGWVVDDGTRALVADDPGAAGRGKVGRLIGGTRNDVFKDLGVFRIPHGAVGTVFFEVYCSGTSNVNFGASTQPAPDNYGAFGPQFRIFDVDVSPRDGGVFTDTGFDVRTGTWMKVWLVVDNANDTIDAYLQEPDGLSGQVLVADDFAFRVSDALDLVNFLAIQGTSGDVYIDNLAIDPGGVNLTSPTDADGDGMDDSWEVANFGDTTRDGTADFDSDNLNDLGEFVAGTDPLDTDTDGDTLLDGDEVAGTSNSYDGAPTDPLASDSDGDGVNDSEENGSLNTEFANAATDPNDADTDGDGMDDGYELANNTPGTALDPNDASGDQAPGSDRDGDSLSNLDEFSGSFSGVQTRADLPDTDADGLPDGVEDNTGTWVSAAQTGTNPVLPDSDGDGLLDGQEDFSLVGFPGQGVVPTNSNPNEIDSDLDGYSDLAEMTGGSDPRNAGSVPAGAVGFFLVEDFEVGHAVGLSIDGVNGWSASAPSQALVASDPDSGLRSQVGHLIHGGTSVIDRALGGARIGDGTTGTLFFELFFPSDAGLANLSLGLSDVSAPTTFSDFEAQSRFYQTILSPRNGSGFTDTPYTFRQGEWMQVWLVADNATDTMDLYIDSPVGSSGPVLVADDFAFRNGTASPLEQLLLIHAPDKDFYIDNIFVDPGGQNLDVPPIAGFEPVAVEDAVEVGVTGSIRFDPLANDTGSIDAGSVTVVTAPTSGTASVDASTGEIVYKHTGSGAGADVLRYRIENPGATLSSEADVLITISGELRLANVTVDIPLDPPAAGVGELVVEDGLPGLTFASAVAMSSVPGNDNALLVASINGTVWYVPDTTAASPTKHAILDVSSLSNYTRGRSIYSIEPYPDFMTSGNLIVNYQGDGSRLPMNGGTFDTSVITGLDKNGVSNTEITCDLRVSRFTLSPAHIADAVANGMSAGENAAALATEHPFINMAEQHLYHSINDAKFGPDGYLYISFGDEGDQGDPHRNGQLITKDFYSSMLRIDVDPASTHPKPNPYYAIAVGPLNGANSPNTPFTDAVSQDPNFRVPPDNPFIHTSFGGGWSGDFNGQDLTGQLLSVRTEIWALGLRNPFKFHLDQEDGTGETEAWIGDVGKSDREEFTILKKGENAGWSYYEGDIVTPGVSHASMPAGATPHKAPLFAYPHLNGNNSATGGIYYRDSELGQLTDSYVCGDYGSGRIWSVLRDGTVTELTNLRLGGGDIVDFNLDPVTKDIFVLEHSPSGRVMRITEQGGTDDEGYPATLSETGVFADLADLSPNPGVVAYTPNLTFWSDGAEKRRWFVMKDLADTMGYSQDDPWSFPEGMVWIKHFEFDLDQQNPGTNVKRLETRILVRNAAGSYGVSYRWNEAGTEANLSPTEGEGFTINFTDDGGGAQSFEWKIPSRAECSTCHTATAGHALSSNTRQFNLDDIINGQSGNLLTLLSDGGYLSGFPGNPESLPRHYRPDESGVNLEERVRSYLAVNCAYCHQPGGGAPDSWDGRPELSLDLTHMLYGQPVSEGTPDLTDHIVRPGDKANSSIWNKINARTAINGTFNGYSQMPPLASNRFDEEGIALLEEWIDNYANVPPSHSGITNVPVTEGSVIGTFAGTADATDPDVRSGGSDQANLTYAITGGNPDEFFTIDSLTGEIAVTGWLDHEELASYILQVTASDNFAPNPMSVTTDVTVNVTDVANEDANANGLPDTWEDFFNLSGATAGGDGDKDGVSEFFELLTGGDPLDPVTPNQPIFAMLPAQPVGDSLYTWRYMNGFELGTDYLLQGSGGLTGWGSLVSGVDYEVVTDVAEEPGYRRMTVRLLIPPAGRYFLRLSSP
ncbi:cadherin tandem repeat domain-containing protein [Haloferula helveola]|uniref:Cadherin tandem repeat domain-containing protein n=1 Tax=Haloferula helveola TaxID=490095 RepID=A0ABN6H032_9BACT|nr:cadherin tandem repeat domain-containing protein [Haloferula helveola]